jgi:hypothetical protein
MVSNLIYFNLKVPFFFVNVQPGFPPLPHVVWEFWSLISLKSFPEEKKKIWSRDEKISRK